MKVLKITMLSIMMAFVFTACSKDGNNSNDKPVTIDGIWSGKVVNDTDKSSAFYSFNFKNDGELNRIDESGNVTGTGTWSSSDNIILGSYKTTANGKFSVIGTYNKNIGKILGNWGYGSSTTNGGTWEMTKSK